MRITFAKFYFATISYSSDGKIFITNLEQVVRIRTGETGEEAI